MSAALKLRIATTSANEALWRVAETDDVDELARVLSRDVDVNSRNQHGMTALMRAAYHGNAEMVRVLLEHGADPNFMRNDRFTALALAAFFGHTETVRVLIEHGAKTEVVTRCGTSAQMWATARTFKEAARCLELQKRKPVAAPVVAASPAVAPPSQVVVAPTAVVVTSTPVKTLKEPPEIWDLVHEVPRGFDPRSAFMSRLASMHRGVVVCVLFGLLLIVGCGVGVFLLRGPQASVVKTEPVIATPKVESAPVATQATQPETTQPEPTQPAAAAAVQPVNVVNSASRRVPIKQRAYVPPVVVDEQPTSVEPEKPAIVAAPPVEKPKAKPVEGLSPQLLTPTQNGKPKAKVIQWP